MRPPDRGVAVEMNASTRARRNADRDNDGIRIKARRPKPRRQGTRFRVIAAALED